MHPDDVEANQSEDRVAGGVGGFLPSKLKTIRRDAHLSRSDVAVALGISGSTVRNWEEGLARPRPSHLAALADLFERPVEQFLRDTARLTLRQLRERAGLTIRDAARLAGTSMATIGRVEAGSQLLGPTAPALATAYGVSVDELADAWQYGLDVARRRARRQARGQ